MRRNELFNVISLCELLRRNKLIISQIFECLQKLKSFCKYTISKIRNDFYSTIIITIYSGIIFDGKIRWIRSEPPFLILNFID